jgi:ATP-dependent helicase HepA
MSQQFFSPGQRYRSTTEPELGLGTIQSVEHRTITIHFPVTGETRSYVKVSAPLKRVIFKQGDIIKNKQGRELKVRGVIFDHENAIYQTEQGDIAEIDISATTDANTALDRFSNLAFDRCDDFEMRRTTWEIQYSILTNPLLGMSGGRINLYEHQLYIANKVVSLSLPRVLLADEVGLGKTVEALVIIHRYLKTGMIKRVLLFVPDTLLLQWRAELFYRFSIQAVVIDKRLSDSFTTGYSGDNIFDEHQVVLTSPGTFKLKKEYAEQVAACNWDMLVADEVHQHHHSSFEFNLIKRVCGNTARVLFLTAAPLQLGIEEHFHRLQLLDPDRFHSLSEFQNEYEAYSELVSSLNCNDNESTDLSGTGSEVIDRFGPGRIMFRNTRQTVPGFVRRRLLMHTLPPPDTKSSRQKLIDEFRSDMEITDERVTRFNFDGDPRITWLLSLLSKEPNDKFVLFCTTPEKAIAVALQLKNRGIQTALFHENLALDKRDNAVLWFVSTNGARVLVCSEAGSEGRNFQVTNNLVLFDLPLHLELLEQRIGRLDRIGQTKMINIHLPVIAGSALECMGNMIHLCLDGFEQVLNSADSIMSRWGNALVDFSIDYAFLWIDEKPDLESLSGFPGPQTLEQYPEKAAEISSFFDNLKTFAVDTKRKLEAGRDLLLEKNSFDRDKAREIVAGIHALDEDHTLEYYMLDVFEKSGIRIKPLDNRTYHLSAGNLSTDIFPVFTKEGVTITFDRKIALTRDDMAFITIDHPFVERAIDFVTRKDTGTVSIVTTENSFTHRLLLELIFVFECTGNPSLTGSLLPPVPVRIVIDSDGNNVTSQYKSNHVDMSVKEFPEDSGIPSSLVETFGRQVKELVTGAQELAATESAKIEKESLEGVSRYFKKETLRIDSLLGKEKSKSYITLLESHRILLQEQFESALQAVKESRVRLDSMRIIVSLY